MLQHYTEKYHSSIINPSNNLPQSCKFLLNSILLCGPLRCLINSWRFSNDEEQKQQLNFPLPSDMMFRWTEHKCLSRWAFCLNMATHSRQANGFSPVCTRKCVFRFHDIPNCFPQYSHLYSRSCCIFPPPCTGDVDFPSESLFPLLLALGSLRMSAMPTLPAFSRFS